MIKEDSIKQDLEIWFNDLYNWQKHLFNCLLDNVDFNKDKINEIYELSRLEFNLSLQQNEILINTKVPDFSAWNIHNKDESITVNKISSISGIGALNTTDPLEFTNNINVIYGENGSGKSSYIKLLKNIFQSKGSDNISSNIFVDEKQVSSAKITFTSGNEIKERQWTKGNDNDDLPLMEIYDTKTASIYVSNDNEVIYEPDLLTVFSKMVTIIDLISEKFKKDLNLNKERILILSEPFMKDNIIRQFNNQTTKEKLLEYKETIKWNNQSKSELDILNQSLETSEPEKLKNKLVNTTALINEILNELKNLCNLFSDKNINDFLSKKQNFINKKRLSEDDAKKVFATSSLEGIGTESWRFLWEAAREYSLNMAYKHVDFPNISDHAHCVLCHQKLSDQAKERMSSFENYILSSVEMNVKKSEKEFKIVLNRLDRNIEIENTLFKCDALGLRDDFIDQTRKFYNSIKRRKETILKEDTLNFNEVYIGSDIEEIKSYYTPFVSACQKKENSVQSVIDNKKLNEKKKVTLLTTQFMYENNEIWTEKEKNISLKKAFSATNTRKISIMKSLLSEKLITNEYILSFQKEIEKLGANNIKVSLVKSGTQKGKIYHKIILTNSTKKAALVNILSEGEFRVISIAAYLADLNYFSNHNPLIFDDPISSLDHIYEEKVAKRIIELSKERQIIIFTHRLTFAYLIELYAKNTNKCSFITLRKYPLGTPTKGLHFLHQKMKTAINLILNNEVPKIKKLLLEKKFAEYDTAMKSLCSSFRIIVEKGIETELLSGIVLRFSRNISSMKIKNLNIIEESDVQIFDSLMTKYSSYEHSHSEEMPVSIINLGDIIQDLEHLKEWECEFSKRKI